MSISFSIWNVSPSDQELGRSRTERAEPKTIPFSAIANSNDNNNDNMHSPGQPQAADTQTHESRMRKNNKS